MSLRASSAVSSPRNNRWRSPGSPEWPEPRQRRQARGSAVEARSQLDRKADVALLPQLPHVALVGRERQEGLKILGDLTEVAGSATVEDRDEQPVRCCKRPCSGAFGWTQTDLRASTAGA
jgi:hypothetical protein